MKTKKMFSKVLAAALAVLMLVGMIPVFASAAENEAAPTADTSATDDLVLNKTATLKDDGTYTIVLDAYAKGQVSTTTLKKVVPTDVILVLDQSASMTQESIDGIPSGTYIETTATNAQLADSSNFYYYKVGEEYNRLTATKEIISKTVEWVGDDDNIYTEDQLAYSWKRKSDGQEYTTARPFVRESLKTFTRTHDGLNQVPFNFRYVNDDGSGEESGGSDLFGDHSGAAGARYYFVNGKSSRGTTYTAYGVAPRTAEFHNDGAPSEGDTNADDPFYVAASYIGVTRKEVSVCRYVYTYTDEDGRTATIGTSAEDIENNLNNINAAVSPIYIQGTTEGTRLAALKYAAEKFIDNIYVSAVANGVDHRVAVVGFATDDYTGTSSEHYYSNSELFVGATQYNIAEGGKKSTYNTTGNLAEDHYTEAFQSVRTETGYNNLYASVDALAGDGATHPQLGFQMANGIFGANDATGRNRVVIFLTDGQPGDRGYDATVANDTITQASTTKTTYGAKVFTVAVLNESEVNDNIDTFLKTVASDGTYTLATSTAALEGFFETVDQEISGTTTEVTLSENAYLVDRLSDYFVVPEGFSVENNVTVQIAKHVGYGAFGASEAAPAGVVASVSYNTEGTEIRGVSVRGFNFISDENLVWDNTDNLGAGSVQAGGNKLIVTIEGLLAKDEAAVGTYINTNNETSGLWDTDGAGNYGMLKAFPMPHTLLDKKTFVLDYAKGAELDVYNATRFDSAADFLFSKVSESNNTYAGNYGSVATVEGKVIYTPNTMKWDGYDTFYALGKDATKGDESTKNIWSKVNVMPANNVYYEDTFITNTAANIVGITYDGNWSEVETGDNAEDANGGVHGWVEDLADDTGDSDGTNHSSTKLGATATFTFTGTGFDVYSRTNMYSGMVYAKITWKEINSEGVEVTRNKGLYVNTESVSGEYYNIPTLWFNGDYNTYTVTISVESAPVTNDGTTYSYCIDGIRIYNPIGDNIDDTVAGAYGDELAAYFESLRDFLLDAESLIDDSTTPDVDESTEIKGAVFIDKVENEVGVASNQIAVYEDYGPKNEVYLAKGQSIAFNVGEGVTSVQIGLKAPQASTNALVSFVDDTGNPAQGDITVGHTTDLFYTVTPDAKGNVIIKNNGEGLLSITKIKWLAIQETSFALTSTDALLLAADEFDTMPVVAYSLRASAPETEDSTDPETPVEPEQPAEPESPVEPETPTEPEEPTEPSGPNVEIENPEVPQQPDIEAVQEQIKQFVTSLFSAFRGWFGRQ